MTFQRLVRQVGPSIGLCWLLGLLVSGLPSVGAEKAYVPLPIFTTDPNEGETYGALLAIIDAQEP